MRSLPFLYEARLLAEDRAVVLEAMPCSVWPATSQQIAASAVQHDHRGEAPLTFAGADLSFELAFSNRRLVVSEGPLRGTYVIVGAVAHSLLPHVALELRKMGA